MISRVVAGDIGGTKGLFGAYDVLSDGRLVLRRTHQVLMKDAPSAAALLLVAEKGLGVSLTDPGCISLAITGVDDGEGNIYHTEFPDGVLRLREALRQIAPNTKVVLGNDFMGQAYGLFTEVAEGPENTLHICGPEKVNPNASKLITGPGTGKGVATLHWDPKTQRFYYIRSEGGSALLPWVPGLSDFYAVVAALCRQQKLELDVERVVSGWGLSAAHYFRTGVWHDPMKVNEHLADEDVRLVLRVLGLACRSLVLINYVEGAVYIAGGVLPRLQKLGLLQPNLPWFEHEFCDSMFFEERMLRRIPVKLLLGETGLWGAAYLGARADD